MPAVVPNHVTPVLVIGRDAPVRDVIAGLADACCPVLWMRPGQEPPQTDQRVTVFSEAELLSLEGSFGKMTARISQAGGSPEYYRLGAVVLAEGPPLVMNFWSIELSPSPRVIGLSELVNLLAEPEKLCRRLTDRPAPALGMTLGIGRPAPAGVARLVIGTARILAEEMSAGVTVFTRSEDAETGGWANPARQARRSGVQFSRVREQMILVRDRGGRVDVNFYDETHYEDLKRYLDLLVIDEVPISDDRYLRLLAGLGLTEEAIFFPSHAPRDGVFTIGPAAGDYEPEAQSIMAGQLVDFLKKRLHA